jgi:hypothetical protein
MSEVQPSINTLERCLESLAFCQVQDESRWAAARIVAQQDIDEFMRDAGPELADKHQALSLLMVEFELKFPDGSDPVLIRSYMRRQMRRIGYDIQHVHERAEDAGTVSEMSAPATAPAEAFGNMEAESERGVTEQQGST